MYFTPYWDKIYGPLYPYITKFPYTSCFGHMDSVVSFEDAFRINPLEADSQEIKALPCTEVVGELLIPSQPNLPYITHLSLTDSRNYSLEKVVHRDRISIACFQAGLYLEATPVNPRNFEHHKGTARDRREAEKLGVHKEDYEDFFLHRGNARSYLCRVLSHTSKLRLTCYYHMGSGLHALPSVGRVLEVLMSDRNTLEDARDMWDWFEATGTEPSRESELLYKECIENTSGLERALKIHPELEQVYEMLFHD